MTKKMSNLPKTTHVDRFSNFLFYQRGSNEGILGMADRIPRGTPVSDPGYFVL